MRALLQRVREANVTIDGKLHNRIGRGLLIFLGVTHNDTIEGAQHLARRCADMRIFEDNEGKMNLSVKDISGEALVISQFTLYADTRKGNRPSFVAAAAPEYAEQCYDEFIRAFGDYYRKDAVRTGVFRAMMDIQLINDGPVTVMVETKDAHNSGGGA
jgi:D-tyrosyl-tRNA(Tyr) deacylase